LMTSIIKDTVTNLQTGEATAIAGLQSKVPLQQVVEAVMQAEQSLHTAVVVRDKVVGAYLEISRMQI
ncbi:MAG TPA: flagellar hook-basal body complex protein FliE, partial [Hyphomicrobium sp.]|nr:flagellar hook-basal body complex protein FliE [Hyphomicrobium sp.]